MTWQAPIIPKGVLSWHRFFQIWYYPVVLTLNLSLMVALLLSGCAGSTGTGTIQGKLVVVGSTALQPLAAAAASLFQKQYTQVQVTVQGGGSVAGLDAVSNHRTDIGDSDLYADPATYSDPNLTDHLICAIPFAIVVGRGIPITSLTHQQIIDIFSTGKIRNWQQVGGPDLPIVPIIRTATSGTRATFRKYVLGGLEESGTLLASDSSKLVHDRVANTPGAIGYLALSVLDSSLHTIAIDGKAATAENIESGSYTFWGYEHMYTLGLGNAEVTSFLNFMMTPAIQQLARQMGYIPINDMKELSLKAEIERNAMRLTSAGLLSDASTSPGQVSIGIVPGKIQSWYESEALTREIF